MDRSIGGTLLGLALRCKYNAAEMHWLCGGAAIQGNRVLISLLAGRIHGSPLLVGGADFFFIPVFSGNFR